MKLALITGGFRRLGAAIAIRLAEEGYALALHAHRQCDPEAELAEVLARTEWKGFVADFANPASAETLFAEVVAHFGRAPDLLVNSASLFGQDSLGEANAATLAEHFAVNASVPALLTQAFAAADGEGDRSIVNIHDQRLEQPHRDQFSYTLSKYALAGLTQVAARALAPKVRVNAVAPGLTLPTADYDAAQWARLGEAMPLQRLSAPRDIADAVAYLASARAVTGQVLTVDGGAHMKSFDRDFARL